MKNLIILLLLPLLSFSQPKDSAKISDSIEIVKNLKRLDKVNQETKSLLKESVKVEREKYQLFSRLITYLKSLISEKHIEFQKKDSGVLVNNEAVKPEEYQPIKETKDVKEQKPKTFIGKLFARLFGKKKDSIQ